MIELTTSEELKLEIEELEDRIAPRRSGIWSYITSAEQ